MSHNRICMICSQPLQLVTKAFYEENKETIDSNVAENFQIQQGEYGLYFIGYNILLITGSIEEQNIHSLRTKDRIEFIIRDERMGAKRKGFLCSEKCYINQRKYGNSPDHCINPQNISRVYALTYKEAVYSQPMKYMAPPVSKTPSPVLYELVTNPGDYQRLGQSISSLDISPNNNYAHLAPDLPGNGLRRQGAIKHQSDHVKLSGNLFK
jgi:hypothetical protein